MLVFNFKKVIRMKGINKPHAYLLKGGINSSAATNIIHNKLKLLSPEMTEKICLVLGCVPHDFMEWRPDKPEEQNSQPLRVLIPKEGPKINLREILKDFPPGKIEQLVEFAKELKK